MSELKDLLINISEEKREKIIPENIKEGVTIYGVTGTHQEGIDTADATATAINIDKDLTAYVNGTKITGTGPILDSSTPPYMLPQIDSTIGKSEILSFGDEVFYLVNGTNVSGTGYVVTIKASQLPVDVRNKSIFIRYSPYTNNSSNSMFLELFLLGAGCKFSLKEGQDRVLGYDASGNRVNIDVYRIWKSYGVLEDVTSTDWEAVGSKSYYDTGNASGWYNYVTNDMYSLSGLSVGPFYNGHSNEDCIIKTTFGSQAPLLRLKEGGALYTRLDNTQLATSLGITSDIIKSGINILGVEGSLSTDNQLEYDEALSISNAIITGSSPKPYTALEYIESDGNSWVNTGYKPNANTNIEMAYSNYTTSGVLFGAYDTKWEDGYGLYANSSDGLDAYFWFHYYGNYNTNIESSNVTEASVAITGNVITINETNTYTATSATIAVDKPLYIFGGNMGGNIEQPTMMRLSKFIIKEGDVVVHNYIPAIYSLTGEVGLYDIISDGFIKNIGTGTFTAGPEIEVE